MVLQPFYACAHALTTKFCQILQYLNKQDYWLVLLQLFDNFRLVASLFLTKSWNLRLQNQNAGQILHQTKVLIKDENIISKTLQNYLRNCRV